MPEARTEGRLARGLVDWVIGCVVVYLGLFGIGAIVLGRSLRGLATLVVAVALAAYLIRSTKGGAATTAAADPVRTGVV